LKKIPELTALFWITKIVATTLGETGGDLFSMTLNLGYAQCSLIFIGFFLVLVTIQLLLNKYLPSVYWLVILATSTAGTTMSDYMDRTLGFGYAKGSLLLVSILIIILVLWKITQKSLSVTTIMNRKVELFYWVAILFSNTLGTALGDYLADDSGLGFGGSALLIGSVLVVLLLAHYFTKLSAVFLFWAAFVLTRPFGATFGDLLTKTTAKGGLGYGTKGASLLLFVLLIALIWSETKRLKPT
jgi:uncharacterized membrane-anchored protein